MSTMGIEDQDGAQQLESDSDGFDVPAIRGKDVNGFPQKGDSEGDPGANPDLKRKRRNART